MRFANEGFLVFALLVPFAGLFWAFLHARREKRLARFVAPSLRARLMPPRPRVWGLQASLVLTGLFLTLVAAARPQWGRATERVVERRRNVAIALDVSRSMLAEDVRPNRLERAKADVADLIDALGPDRCALVAFRRTGVLVCPLTTDRGFLRSALERLSPDSAPRGETDLGAALRASLEALDPVADDYNAIILISDGGDLRGEALKGAALAKARGIPVFTVGIGNPAVASPIPDAGGTSDVSFKGSPVLVKLEESSLKAIADASGGRYVPLATSGTAETTLGSIYRRFLRQVAAQEQSEEATRAADRFAFFLVPGLVCLLAGASLSKGRMGRLKK